MISKECFSPQWIDEISAKLEYKDKSLIEKDFWVTEILNILFSLPYADKMVFKGLCVAIHKPFYEQ